MSLLSENRSGLLWAVAVAIYLKFLLQPTGWVFYELHHLLGVDAVYWGYSVFRGAGYYFGVWEYQNLACLAAGLAVLGVSWWRHQRQKSRGIEHG